MGGLKAIVCMVLIATMLSQVSALSSLRGGMGIRAKGKEPNSLGLPPGKRGVAATKKSKTSDASIVDPVVVISKLVGIGIVSGSFFLKMPQIVKILTTSSVEGLSPMAVYHEIPLYMSGVIYHYLQDFPLSTYGEMVVVMVQNIIIVLLMWWFQEPATEASEVISMSLQGLAFGLVALNLPRSLQPILAFINVPFLLSSCVPQVLTPPPTTHTSSSHMAALSTQLRKTSWMTLNAQSHHSNHTSIL